jgi:tRNA threonylcarbamoyladenosine biosynthesis protein TsaE
MKTMERKSKSIQKDLNTFNINEKRVFKTPNANKTKELGKAFASCLKKGDIVFFIGDLGSGKTTFIQGLISAFVSKKYIRSSSFTIASEYEAKGIKIFHLDLYRLENLDIFDIGIEEYLYSTNITLIEWAQKLKKADDIMTWRIKTKYIDENSREIVIERKK